MRRALLAALLLLLAPALGGIRCTAGPVLPPLAAVAPADGASGVARSVWPALDFAAPVDPAAIGALLLLCDGVPVGTRAHRLDADSVVVQPDALLPAAGDCQLVVGTDAGPEVVRFATAPGDASFRAVYDRTDPDRPLPFPDDFFLAPDAGTATGYALDLTLPDPPGDARLLLGNIARVAEEGSDGWSPIGNLGVQLSQAPDPASLPLDRVASLDPLGSVALLDLTPGSPTHGERIPFKLVPRSDTFPPEPVAHTLVIFPGIPLEPRGTYGLVVTDRVLSGTGGALRRSAFFDGVVSGATPGEPPEAAATRPLAEEVLLAAEALSPVPIPRRDVALAVRLTVRSTDAFPDDLLAMREDVKATPPNVQVQEVSSAAGGTRIELVGTFDAPSWGDGARLARGADGLPQAIGTRTIPFEMALPPAAASGGGAPLVMYQHGSPGSAQEEVPRAFARFLGGAGFAVAGFTDVLNRRFATSEEQQFAILGATLFDGQAPDFYVQTYAEQMAFVQALQSMATLDVLPVGAPDGVPDVDPSVLVYEGISYGSNHAQALLAYEPGIEAAALVVGAVRFIELLEHQDRTTPLGGPRLIEEVLPDFVSGLRAPDLVMGLALFALTYDRQDPQNHARFLYRDPLVVDGTAKKASILVVEGLDDSFTANNSTRSLAWLLGPVPQLAPALVRVPDLPLAAGPVQGNVAADTTAAFVQYAPAGGPVPPTPGCELQPEGHFCAQSAPSARAQRLDFYESALVGVPVID